MCGRYVSLHKVCWEEKSKEFLPYINVRMIKMFVSMASFKICNGQE